MVSKRAEIVTNTDLAYMAGFFDGEGCISVGKNGSLELSLVNSARRVLERFQKAFGGSIKNRPGVNKQMWQWSLYGESACTCLFKLFPFIDDKLDQAECALEWMDKRTGFTAKNAGYLKGKKADPNRMELLEAVRNRLSRMKKECSI